jgi:hypothetical protein
MGNTQKYLPWTVIKQLERINLSIQYPEDPKVGIINKLFSSSQLSRPYFSELHPRHLFVLKQNEAGERRNAPRKKNFLIISLFSCGNFVLRSERTFKTDKSQRWTLLKHALK